MIFRHLLNMRSHPTWVRGLKQVPCQSRCRAMLSHPTWVRGLKQAFLARCHFLFVVAPYVGAWIETKLGIRHDNSRKRRTLRGCVD